MSELQNSWQERRCRQDEDSGAVKDEAVLDAPRRAPIDDRVTKASQLFIVAELTAQGGEEVKRRPEQRVKVTLSLVPPRQGVHSDVEAP